MEIFFQLKGFTALLDLFLKSSVILSLALGFCFFARKQPASIRHLVLGISLISLLLLPFLSALMPGWQTGLIPSWTTEPSESNTVTILQYRPSLLPYAESKNLYQLQAHLSAGDQAIQRVSRFLQPQFRMVFITLWFLVCSFILAKTLFGLYGAFRLTRQGIFMNDYPWQHLFLWFLEKMSLKRNVRLIKNHRVMVPMTWGVLKPVVLMPAASSQWPMEHCSSVLFHELSHVKRGDFLVLLLCRMACALYWLNPLSWIAFKLLRKEQEKACDEMVLKTGIKPSTYASALLRLKQTLDKGHYMPSPAVGMAGNSELNERLTTILEKKFKTKEIKMKTKLILLLMIVLTITFIATAKPDQTQSTKTDQAVVAKDNADNKANEEKPKLAGADHENDPAKGEHKCSEKCIHVCTEKGKHICIIKRKNDKNSDKVKEKEIVVIVNDDENGENDENDKGEKKEVEKIVICKGHADEKDIEKHITEFEKNDGKEGKTCKHIIIKKGKDAEPEIVKIKEGKDGNIEKDVIYIKRCDGKGKTFKLELSSENKMSSEALDKVKVLIKTLDEELPDTYKVTSELSESQQKIIIDCPIIESESEEYDANQKYIDEFEKEFKNLLPVVDGKKTLQKKIFIKKDVKEEKEEV